MTDRIPTYRVDKITLMPGGTLRSMISQGVFPAGKKLGRDRWLDGSETAWVRIAGEQYSGNITLRQAAARAGQLLPFLVRIAAGEFKEDVFAVEAWKRNASGIQRTGVICHGARELGECVTSLARQRWINLKVLNLSAIVIETQLGFEMAAADDPSQAGSEIINRAPEDMKALVSPIVTEMLRRLAIEPSEEETLAKAEIEPWTLWRLSPHGAGLQAGARAS
jgi:hypothetical protein